MQNIFVFISILMLAVAAVGCGSECGDLQDVCDSCTGDLKASCEMVADADDSQACTDDLDTYKNACE